MTRETLDREASDAADSLVELLHEVARPGKGDGWDERAYERGRLAGRRGLASLWGTDDERAARERTRVAALQAATLAGYREQGMSDCDVCGTLATFVWARTEAYRKKHHGPKIKGSRVQLLPVSWRCATHVPTAFPELGEQYRDARVSSVSVEAVA